MRRIFLIVLALASLTASANAQNFVPYNDKALFAASSQSWIQPAAYAQITVCGPNAGTQSCTPTVSVYSNSTGMGGAITQPFLADAFGNFFFFALPGAYTVCTQFQNYPGACKQVVLPSLSTSYSYFSVTRYGAVGNGTTDDTAAFNAAFSACQSAGGGGVISPGGLTFLVKSDISIPSNCSMDLSMSTVQWDSGCNCSFIISGSNNFVHHVNFNGANNIGVAVYIELGASNFDIGWDKFTNFINGMIYVTNQAGSGTDIGPGSIHDNSSSGNMCGASQAPIFGFQLAAQVHHVSIHHNTFLGDCYFDIGVDSSGWGQVTDNFIGAAVNNVWAPSTSMPLAWEIIDSAYHIQQVTTAGTTASSEPAFNDSGGTTTDNGVTWTDRGVTYGGGMQIEASHPVGNPDVSHFLVTGNTISHTHIKGGGEMAALELVNTAPETLSDYTVCENDVSYSEVVGISATYVTNDNNFNLILCNNRTSYNADSGLALNGSQASITGNVSWDNGSTGSHQPEFSINCLSSCSFTGNVANDDQATKTGSYSLTLATSPWGPVTLSGNTLPSLATGSILNGQEVQGVVTVAQAPPSSCPTGAMWVNTGGSSGSIAFICVAGVYSNFK